ncbi:tripartite tricarboxylate transporter TctB family protein [Roseomonas marmotae]|uniref:Tripartite tricarboxylate transporter TctB family protein n=1 Tax=Roseomonas marmotae TaxID=2768161 RepID=A0ABS3KCC9_9PROT|nr:tripartite tricarboxylate transporter TctB family protein [Roseomonas marmotae]MBO1074570.1 tripartite tricarboxylate transporter TctB family protein [Roseomonas marmotae]QTI81601.1 tripartite tricarboxylate transporter TctB family protein [Roseomonas marmotae]
MSGGLARQLGRDRLVALGAAAVAALALAFTFTFDKVPAALMEGMGAAEFPQLICVVILVLCLCLFFARPAPETGEAPAPVHACTWWTLALCVGFFAVLALIGMLPAMFLFPIVTGLVWGERRLPLLIGSAAGLTLLVWLLFVSIFQFTLPGGLLGDMLFS